MKANGRPVLDGSPSEYRHLEAEAAVAASAAAAAADGFVEGIDNEPADHEGHVASATSEMVPKSSAPLGQSQPVPFEELRLRSRQEEQQNKHLPGVHVTQYDDRQLEKCFGQAQVLTESNDVKKCLGPCAVKSTWPKSAIGNIFPLVGVSDCVCSTDSCFFRRNLSQPRRSSSQQEVLRMLLQDEFESSPEGSTTVELFSLFNNNSDRVECCRFHNKKAPGEGSGSDEFSSFQTPGGHNDFLSRIEASAAHISDGVEECDWESFECLDRVLESHLEKLEGAGVLSRMRKSFVSSVAAAAIATRNVSTLRESGPPDDIDSLCTSRDEVASLKSSCQDASLCKSDQNRSICPWFYKSDGESKKMAVHGPWTLGTPNRPKNDTSPETSILPQSVALPSVADLGRVESGGLFSAIALVNMQCKRIRTGFLSVLPSAKNCIAVADSDETAAQPNEPLKCQHLPSVQHNCQASQTLPKQYTGAWEIAEHLGHIYASFSDATWFFLGCSAAQLWRRLLRNSNVSPVPRLHVTQVLHADDRVEGCFIIDKVLRLSTGKPMVHRRVLTGLKGRSEFIDALCTPFAVARGWVVNCNREKEVILIRLVAVEVYPPHRENGGQSEAQGVASHPGSMACGSISSRLLSPEVDYDTQAVYAALPLKSIPRNDVIGGQASGCSGRFVCCGTSVRVCLILDPVDDVGLRTEARSRVDEALESAASCLPPRLSRAMLSDVHAHVEATVVLPEVFKSNTCALTLLQQPLGFTSILPHDSEHPQAEARDFLPINAAKDSPKTENGGHEDSVWDGGSCCLHRSMLYALESSETFMNPTATTRQLEAFSSVHYVGLPCKNGIPDNPSACQHTDKGSLPHRTPSNALVFSNSESWVSFAKRMKNSGAFSLLAESGPYKMIGLAMERAYSDPCTRGAGVGRLIAQKQGVSWAQKRLASGVAYARKKQIDAALQLYDSALQLRPDYADAYIARGAAYANKLEYDKAAADLDKALELEPTNRHALKYRAMVSERIAQREKERERKLKAEASGDRDRTPSPDRHCKSPDVPERSRTASSICPGIPHIKTGPSFPGPIQSSSLSVPVISAQSQHHEQFMLLQQQKHRAQILQKQLEQMDALKWQIIEKKRQEQMKQQQQERQMLLQQQQLKQAKGVTKPDVKLDIKPEIVTASRTESRSKSNHKHKKHKKSSKLSQGKKKRKRDGSSSSSSSSS